VGGEGEEDGDIALSGGVCVMRSKASPFSEKKPDRVGSFIVTKCPMCWPVHCRTLDV